MSEHKQLPLATDLSGPDARIICNDSSSFRVGDIVYHPENKEFAEFIVRACNAHEKLVEACRLAVCAMIECEMLQQIREALALAEKGESK